MDDYRRFGVYVIPQGPLYDRGAGWLGWDTVARTEVAQPKRLGLDPSLSDTPRKYGFHGTIKPPFRLAKRTDFEQLRQTAATFCAQRAPLVLPKMEVRALGRFIAIVPTAPAPALADLAAATVAGLDRFRAPLTEAEGAKRRRANLSPAQEAHLATWGYPYVMDQFRFHMTLTGRLPEDSLEPTRAALADYFAECLSDPLVIDSLCLVGEASDGRFHMLHRLPLSGGETA